MSDTKISALPAATAALGTDELPINEAGASKKLTVAQIQALILAAAGLMVPDANWIAPTFQNGWTNFGAPYATAGYRKDALGVVWIKGLVKGSSPNAIFTLPAGYRPAETKHFAVESSVGTPPLGVIYIRSDGVVWPDWAYADSLSLNVSFLAEA